MCANYSGALISAVTDALKQAGVDPEKMTAKEVEAGVDEEVTGDVVIAGAGTSGTGAIIFIPLLDYTSRQVIRSKLMKYMNQLLNGWKTGSINIEAEGLRKKMKKIQVI